MAYLEGEERKGRKRRTEGTDEKKRIVKERMGREREEKI